MPRKKPVFVITENAFRLGTATRFSLVGRYLDPNGTGHISVKLRAKNIYWVHQSEPVVVDDRKVDLYAKPRKKNDPTYDVDDDLTVTVTVSEGTPDEETTEVTYDDIEYQPARTGTKPKGKRAAKKRK